MIDKLVMPQFHKYFCWQWCVVFYYLFCNSFNFFSRESLFFFDVIHLGSRLPKLLLASSCPLRSLNFASMCSRRKSKCVKLYAHKVCSSKSVFNHKGK